MKKLFLVFLLLLAFPVVASHIVGGEFEILHVSGNTYRVNFILYFDLSGNAGAKDPNITARIFRKRDNAIMQDVFLPRISETDVVYTQPACSEGGVKTSKLVYSTLIQMTPSQYSDSKGYYIAWERCCRNYNSYDDPDHVELINILSANPAGAPNASAAGQTFYLEFPPVVKDGKPFINSTPQLFPPLSDYACIGKPYYTDFAGTDLDGDSLVYSMVTPLNTHSSVALPPDGPGSAPYPIVNWIAPYSLTSIIGGNPDLKISKDGLLTGTPGNTVGLFVFAVMCEEFRNKKKIGEVRRDFQMYVVACEDAVPPQITGRKLNETNFTYTNNMTVTFSNTVEDANRCIEVKITDQDAITDFSENVKIRAIPLGFKKNVGDVLPEISSAVLTRFNNEKIFKICFDKCPYVEGPFQIGIIAADDACSLPLLDTLKIMVNIQPPNNTRPYFTTPDVAESVPEGFQRSWSAKGFDDDKDVLTVDIITDGFKLEDAGITLETIVNQNGAYEAKLNWDANCTIYDFTQRADFEVKLVLNDLDLCNFSKPDTMTFNLHIDIPINNKPVIGSNLSSASLENGIDKKIFESLSFVVYGTDVDNDELTITMNGNDFVPLDYGATFPTAKAKKIVSSFFTWDLLCEKVNPKLKNEFEFVFIVSQPLGQCNIVLSDTLTVNVHVDPPLNTAPVLTVKSLLPDVPLIDGHLTMLMGQQMSLNLTSHDSDITPQDKIRLEMVEAKGTVEPVGFQFNDVEGSGTIESPFTWVPDCSIFKNNVFENIYTFKFRTIDDRCHSIKFDTVSVAVTIKEKSWNDAEFIPPNIITPNGDGCNDYFAMEGFDEDYEGSNCSDAVIPNLPPDNCIGRFISIRIFNRWGKEVFQSAQRNFRWLAADQVPGVYFYTIQYNNTEYKGSVTVMF